MYFIKYFLLGNEILECQKTCHENRENNKNITYNNENISSFSFKIDSNQTKQPMEYLNEDEIVYLSTICGALNITSTTNLILKIKYIKNICIFLIFDLDCSIDICRISCQKLWGDKNITNCQDFCEMKIKKSITNAEGVEILQEYFLEKFDSFFNKNLNKSEEIHFKLQQNTHKSLDENIEDTEKKIQKEKQKLIDLETILLSYQKIKTSSQREANLNVTKVKIKKK